MHNGRPTLVMEEVTDPSEIAEAAEQQKRFEANAAWFEAHAAEIYSQHRGKCICIAGGEVFVADTPREAAGLGSRAHPADDGRFVQYIPEEKVPRVYAN